VYPQDHRRPRDASIEAAEPPRRWLRVPAAAEYLGVGIGTLNKLRTYGGGPHYAKPTPGVVAYEVADLDAWMAERKVRSTSERVRVDWRAPRVPATPSRRQLARAR
jgi:predicted DNA-binding transcriptional regulator AlpA